MTACVIFGGAGFIGSHLARHLLATRQFDHVHLADIRPIANAPAHVSASATDVRQPIVRTLIAEPPTWIFNLAAIHREPGHSAQEFFDTNLEDLRSKKVAQLVDNNKEYEDADDEEYRYHVGILAPTLSSPFLSSRILFQARHSYRRFSSAFRL